MYVVVYLFEVKPGKESEFIQAWSEMTHLIYQHEGSLGSRLHHRSGNEYIAYAQWPDEETFEKSGDKLPESANEVRQRMRNSTTKIEVLYRMKMIEDLLQAQSFGYDNISDF